MRKLIHVAVAAMATVALAVVSPTAAYAATWHELINEKNSDDTGVSVVLSIRGGEGAGAGAEAVVWPRSYDSNGERVGDQLWRIVNAGDGSAWLRNGGTSNQFALSVKGNNHADGTPLVQWWFDATNQYQRWEITTSTQPYHYKFRNRATGKCLAVQGGGNPGLAVGARAIIWTCGPGDDQKWAKPSVLG